MADVGCPTTRRNESPVAGEPGGAATPPGSNPSLFDVLDAMEACLANNSAEARRRAQFKNTMLSLIGVARQAAHEQLRAARTAPLTPTEKVLRHVRGRGTGS